MLKGTADVAEIDADADEAEESTSLAESKDPGGKSADGERAVACVRACAGARAPLHCIGGRDSLVWLPITQVATALLVRVRAQVRVQVRAQVSAQVSAQPAVATHRMTARARKAVVLARACLRKGWPQSHRPPPTRQMQRAMPAPPQLPAPRRL